MSYTTANRQKHLIVTLAHYLADGHNLDWTELAAHADPECQEGEESHKIIVRDLGALSNGCLRSTVGSFVARCRLTAIAVRPVA